MKKILSFFLLVGLSGAALAQNEEKETKPAFTPSYAVKWNPGSLVLGKVSMLGEYNYKKKKSITFGIGIPFEKKHDFKLGDSTRELTMKTFSIMGGYRMYMGKKTMTGFYFEPYLKYVKNDAASIITGDIGPDKRNLVLTSEYSGFGVGAQLGVQFMIAKRVVFDIFILGPEANLSHHRAILQDVNATTPWDAAASQDAEDELQESVGELPIIGKKLDIEVDPNKHTVTSDYKGFLPGFRFGGSIGFRF
jgi:hypothetical protein